MRSCGDPLRSGGRCPRTGHRGTDLVDPVRGVYPTRLCRADAPSTDQGAVIPYAVYGVANTSGPWGVTAIDTATHEFGDVVPVKGASAPAVDPSTGAVWVVVGDGHLSGVAEDPKAGEAYVSTGGGGLVVIDPATTGFRTLDQQRRPVGRGGGRPSHQVSWWTT